LRFPCDGRVTIVEEAPMSRVLRDAELLRSDPAAATGESPLLDRLHFAFGPLAASVLLDIADFAMVGPLGLFFGFLIGAPLGWLVAHGHRFPTGGKVLCAVLAGLYCAAPFTELVPLATILTALVRFHRSGQVPGAALPAEPAHVWDGAVVVAAK
jgi:hypothetical protein